MKKITKAAFKRYTEEYTPYGHEVFSNDRIPDFIKKNENRFYEMLKNLIPFFKKGMKICDLGAYPGTFIRILNDLGMSFELHAAGLLINDSFQDAMEKEKINILKVNLDPVHDGKKLYTKEEEYNLGMDGYFDVIVASEIFEHLINPAHLIYTANRALKKGGILLVTTPNLATIKERLKFLAGLSPNVPVEDSIFTDNGRWRPHHRLYTQQEVAQILEKMKFQVLLKDFFHECTEHNYTFAKRIIYSVPRFRHGLLQIGIKKEDLEF